MSRLQAIEAAEAATRDVLRYRDRVRELLDANPLTNGFRLVDPSSVLQVLVAAHAALAAAIKVVGETDWPTLTPVAAPAERHGEGL